MTDTPRAPMHFETPKPPPSVRAVKNCQGDIYQRADGSTAIWVDARGYKWHWNELVTFDGGVTEVIA